MSRIALVRNPWSTRNLKGSPEPVPHGVRLIEPEAPEGLAPALAVARDSGTTAVLIDGGDGTVREVLSRIPEIWGAALPRVGILPRGNTNLIAREVGGVPAGRLSELVSRLATGPAPTERRRALLRVDRPGVEPLRGFILGWGAYAEGTRLAKDGVTAKGASQVALTVLSVLRRVFFGDTSRRLRRGVPAELAIDGAAAPEGRRLIGIVTTLQQPLAAGFDPFWGEGPGPIRWLDVLAPGRNLVLAAPFVAFGRRPPWARGPGYASGRATRIILSLAAPFVMDGELYDPPAGGPIRLSAAEEMVFLSL